MHNSWWEHDTLRLDPDSLAATRREYLAPTTAISLTGCIPSWVAGHIITPEWTPTAPNITGGIIHDCFEQLFKLPPGQRDKENFTQISTHAVEEITLTHGLDSHQYQTLMDLINKNWEGLASTINPKGVDVYATEHKLQGTIGDVPFRGYADLITQDETGYTLIDYKTGKTPTTYKIRKYGDTHGQQITAYGMILAQQTNTTPRDSVLLYTAEGNRRVVKPTKMLQNKIRGLFKNSWTLLQEACDTNTFPTKPGPLCGWCPLVAACPAAATSGYKPRAEGLPTVGDPRLPGLGQPPHRCGMETNTIQENPTATAVAESAPTPNRVGVKPQILFGENKSWEPMAGPYLNGNNYGVQGTFGTIALAVTLLGDAKLTATKQRVETLARCLEKCVSTAQQAISASTAPSDGIATRLRGALRTYIEQCPPPIGDGHTVDELRGWGKKAVTYMRFQAVVAHAMLAHPDKDLDLTVLF